MLKWAWPVSETLSFVLLALVLVPIGFVSSLLMWAVVPFVALKARLTQKPADSTAPPKMDLPPIDVLKLLGAKNFEARYVDGVFEGGGVKAIAQIGAIAAANELNFHWRLLGGTSGGAIVAALLACGQSPLDVWKLLTQDDLSRILQAPYLPHERALRRKKYFILPLLPGLLTFKAVVSGNVFLDIMKTSLRNEAGNDLTFGDLLTEESRQNPSKPHEYRLKIVATDVSRGQPIILPDDLPQYWEPWEHARRGRGKGAAVSAQDTRDRFPVALAVRMSMSIPFVFAPHVMHLNGDGDENSASQEARGKRVEIVDGGVSSNFPIWIFDRTDGAPPTRPTFGFLLDESRTPDGPRASRVPRIWTVVALVRHVIGSGIGAMDNRMSPHNNARTARLQTLGTETTDFGLSVKRQKELYARGYLDAARFFQDFDWNDYLQKYRGGAPNPRQARRCAPVRPTQIRMKAREA